MSISNAISFIRRYVKSPDVTGAIAPSSRYLAETLVAPFAEREKPAMVLEVGAGTGAVTTVIGDLLGPEDRLDVCEIQPELADILDNEILNKGKLGEARRQGRVRLIRGSVEDVDAPDTYDYVISGLPFTAFKLPDVQSILDVIKRNLKPGGTFSYFEYIGLRRMACTLMRGEKRDRIRELSAHLDQQIAKHQFAKNTVWRNVPPAYGRHWSFDNAVEAGSVS